MVQRDRVGAIDAAYTTKKANDNWQGSFELPSSYHNQFMYTARKNVEGNEPERTGLPGNVVRSIKLKYKYFYFFFYKYKYKYFLGSP